MYLKCRDFYLDSIILLLISNVRDYNNYVLSMYKEKSENGYQKLLTKEDRKEFWHEAINNFYNTKLNGKNLKKIEKIDFYNLHEKLMKCENKFNKKFENVVLKYSSIDNSKNSRDMIYKKSNLPLGYQHFKGFDDINNSCPETKLTINANKTDRQYLTDLSKELNLKDLKNKHGNKNKKVIVIVPNKGEGFNENDHVLYADDNLKFNDESNNFEMSSNSGLKYILNPYSNELITKKNDKIMKSNIVDEHVSSDGINYFFE